MDQQTGTKYSLIYTYGCQMNQADSEKLEGQLRQAGYEATDSQEQADLILINTCCVRESAEKKIYGKIGEFKRLKALNPNLILAIAGCMAQKDREKLLKKAPHVDLVLGTNSADQLVAAIEKIETTREKIVAVWEQSPAFGEEGPAVRHGQLNAWVPIMYGCNNFCTYCIVPYVRGRERSRRPEDILAEIADLGRDGFKEIMLLGQNVNSYGKDADFGFDFADLLTAVDQAGSVPRVRYMTSHPRDMNEKVIEAIASGKTLCEHFHLPIQSGSNEIMRRMNRGYTRDTYRKIVETIRHKIPHASLTTDLIVGFPGETEELFLETLEFIKEIQFDAAYTFLYSKRSGTPAATFDEQVTLDVKKDRLNRLMEVQNEVSLTLNRKLAGEIVEVLVEGPSKNDPTVYTGRTRTNKIVLWDKGATEQAGDFISVKIDKAQTWVLKGTRIDSLSK
ncbi:MAG: tRNA (N6-isopentenyl adenosine(37)-C2)-methylthiotransferase MiaB [Sporomusaceae bacterium]|nr:tRNA (N6-isopentenyl adenosine(37)-C2)-methylthiotransferase MiaB [Sporomusaceae bacterium]